MGFVILIIFGCQIRGTFNFFAIASKIVFHSSIAAVHQQLHYDDFGSFRILLDCKIKTNFFAMFHSCRKKNTFAKSSKLCDWKKNIYLIFSVSYLCEKKENPKASWNGVEAKGFQLTNH